MKRTLAYLALGAAALTAAHPAEAGDYAPGIRVVGQGGPAAVPVPAPAPVPNMPSLWYFRADVALGFPGDASLTTNGFALANNTLTTSSSMYKDNNDIYGGYGLGVGYKFSPFVRADLTVDTRGQKQFKAQDISYTGPGGLTGTFNDSVTMRSVATLFNVYFDFNRYGHFVPYVGAGLGFAVNELIRSYSVAETGGLNPQSFSGREKTHDVSLAAMGTAGASFKIDTAISLDVNYRALYIGSSEIGPNNVKVGDQVDHQIRAGVRFDIY